VLDGITNGENGIQTIRMDLAPGPFGDNPGVTGGAERGIPHISEHHMGQPLDLVHRRANKGHSTPYARTISPTLPGRATSAHMK